MKYPFSRILLATEFTEFDSGAERLAFAMAKRCSVPLRVVVPLLSYSEYEAELPEMALKAEQIAGAKIEALRKLADSSGIDLDVRVRRGSEIHTEIVNEARETQTDLIVIRRRGKPSFLARLMVGEMVSKVIRDTSCSVMLVPRAAEFWSNRILAAVGDTPAASLIAKTAGTIAGICGLPLTVVSVASDAGFLPKFENIKNLNVMVASETCDKVSGVVRVGKAVEQIMSVAKESESDLVVIGRQRYHLLPFGNKGLMQHIAGNLNVPTLIMAI